MISHKNLKELLDYDPKTGEFRWTWHRRNAGEIAGSIKKKQGHREIRLKGGYYTAQRLAWFYVHGKWPNIIIFANGDRSDTKIDNLMNVTRSYIHMTRKITHENKSGTVGVHFSKRHGKWVASIQVDRMKHHIGLFENKADAIAARRAEEIFHGFNPDHRKPAAPEPVSFL